MSTLIEIEVGTRGSETSPAEKHLATSLLHEFGEQLDGVRVITGFQTNRDLPEEHFTALYDPILEERIATLPSHDWSIRVFFKPGVTDTLGDTARIALADSLGISFEEHEWVKSYQRYLLSGTFSYHDVEALSSTWLGNPLIQTIEIECQDAFVETIPLKGTDLMAISQERQLALNLKEMEAIQKHLSREDVVQQRLTRGLGPDPTDAELEALAQTWSEHCKHKIFNAKISFEDAGHVEVIDRLFKTYIEAPTKALKLDYLVSLFVDNAGIIRLTKDYNINFKVETHNSPSALDPYGGALTGILGVNRDSMGTGIGARLVANTNVFCFASPKYQGKIPKRLKHPLQVLRGVRRGVEHGGNKMGVPTVNGSLVFDDRYLGKPLVYCGTVGLMPTHIRATPTHEKHVKPGDRIVIAGGRCGKDGIHGATFSSEELREDSPISAVQIGDPFTQKKLHDFLLEAMQMGLYETLTDNGAGGLCSSVGEISELSGGSVLQLDQVPLKYQGLRPWEILLSESQERMTLVVRPEKLGELSRLSQIHDVEISDVGHFTDSGYFDVRFGNSQVLYLSMEFLHSGNPQLELEAKHAPLPYRPISGIEERSIIDDWKALLARPNVASKEAIIRQYDCEVQGQTIIKPGDADGAVIHPLEMQAQNSFEGFALSHGLCPRYSDLSAYDMASNAVDEAIRNLVAVGGDPNHIALLDNFCWPDPIYDEVKTPDGHHKLAQLVLACKALKDATIALDAPFISGKDSMKNDVLIDGVKISVPPTLLISAVAKVPDVRHSVTAEIKCAGHSVYLMGETKDELGGSEYAALLGQPLSGHIPKVDWNHARSLYESLFKLIQDERVASCHDLSDGGLAVALAEITFGTGLGLDLNIEGSLPQTLFSESASRFLITTPDEALEGPSISKLGTVIREPIIRIQGLPSIETQALQTAWQSFNFEGT